MSTNVLMVVVGAVLFFAGLIKAGSRQIGGFNLRNFGINFGGTVTQTNKGGNVTPGAEKDSKPEWIGLAIAAIGLLTAIVGWLKG